MGIPSIASYQLPAEDDLSPGTADWVPDLNRAALLIHDMQQYFVDFFPADSPPLPQLIHNIATLREAGLPVFYTAQPGGMTPQERGLQSSFWGPGMTTDPAHRRVVEPLTPRPDDIVVTKWRYSAFARTDLEAQLRAAGRDQLIICGVYAHLGCMLTAFDAYARDIQPFLVADAIADFTRDEHLMAVDMVARRCGVALTTHAALTTLAAGPAMV